ncbi:MAG: polysaccharide biosynthesis protein GumE [Cellvibrio sp.]|uniref:polysaccharide biosynthesis protein GumE n=1 Tax=Cellvibrio sp. TaxID=1965322 RepID=UPI0027285982|nr:polysaccharide biosynthesis protein GumE [Cellvibrio sp.]
MRNKHHPTNILPANAASRDQWLVTGILLAAVCYQALLCLMNTFGIRTSVTIVGLAEALIMLACLPLLLRRLLPGLITIALLAGAYFCMAAIVSGQLNPKTFRDLAIPLCFFWLGCNLGRPELVERALVPIIWVVIGLGLFELLMLDTYTRFFDIFSYYVSTGNLAPITDYVRESKLQLNGTRPEGIGRTLLPGLLGSHRVSSVFLEPVSLGNFATIIAAWGLSRDARDWRKGLFFVSTAVVMIILCDSRFALILLPLMLIARFFLRGAAFNLALLAPFVAIGLVLLIGVTTSEYGDNFTGRIALSGWALLEFDPQLLLAITTPRFYGDMGYAYLIAGFGLPLCLLLWFSLWLQPMPDERGRRFRAFIALYIALILAISGSSLFAFKTSALLWCLLGCLLQNPAPHAIRRTYSGTSNHDISNSGTANPSTLPNFVSPIVALARGKP